MFLQMITDELIDCSLCTERVKSMSARNAEKEVESNKLPGTRSEFWLEFSRQTLQ